MPRPVLLATLVCLLAATPAWAAASKASPSLPTASAKPGPAIQPMLKAIAATTTFKAPGDYRLVEAAFKGDLARLDTLLAQGANPEALDAHGYTPLLWAAQQGHVAIVDSLVSQGANVEARSRAGHGALMIAVVRGNVEIVRSLLRVGADPRARGPGGQSPYTWAKAHGQSAIVLAMERAQRGGRP